MTLEERMDRLEQRNRQLMVLAAAALAIAVCIGGAGMATAQGRSATLEEVVTRTIRIVNDRDETRAFLAGNLLWLSDEKGSARLTLSTVLDAPSLSMSDSDGVARVLVQIDEGGPSVRLLDEMGDPLWSKP